MLSKHGNVSARLHFSMSPSDLSSNNLCSSPLRLWFPGHSTQAQVKATDESGGPNTYRPLLWQRSPLPFLTEALAVMQCPDQGTDLAAHNSFQPDLCQDETHQESIAQGARGNI